MYKMHATPPKKLKSALYQSGEKTISKHVHFKTPLGAAIERGECCAFLKGLAQQAQEDFAQAHICQEAAKRAHAANQMIKQAVVMPSASIFSTTIVPEFPPLYIAAGMGDVKAFQLLLDLDATFSKEECGPFSKVAMLSIAAYRGYFEMVRCLVEKHSASPSQDYFLDAAHEGDSPLIAAVVGRVHYRAVKMRAAGVTIVPDTQHAAIFWKLVNSGAVLTKPSTVRQGQSALGLLGYARDAKLIDDADYSAFTTPPSA